MDAFGIVLTIIGIIGAFVVGAALLYLEHRTDLFKRRSKPSRQASADSGDPSLMAYRASPTPEEIRKRIKALPPLQRAAAQDSYLSLRVKWRLVLQSADSLKNGKHANLRMASGKHGGFPLILCTIELARYPELKIANADHTLLVMGEIAEVDMLWIRLENCTLNLE